MSDSLPRLILTGASGIVGRSFLPAVQDRFQIYAIARRPQQKAKVPRHPNIHWLQVDIGDREALSTIFSHIRERGGADYVIHLAAHYDFDNIELADYEHTNVNGTRYMLEESKRLGIAHFIFASPDGAVSQRQLFDLATRFQFRRQVQPILMPKPLAWLGVLARDLLGRAMGQRPFERLWMLEYLDRSLTIDGSHTRQVLGWGPAHEQAPL